MDDAGFVPWQASVADPVDKTLIFPEEDPGATRAAVRGLDKLLSVNRRWRRGKNMNRMLAILPIVGALVFLTLSTPGDCGSENPGILERQHNEKGLQLFKKGFYDLAPKNKEKEAAQYYELAEAEFKKAIASNEKFVEAHRSLARVYHVQKKHERAAEEYRKVIELDPYALDDYVNLSVAYAELGNYDLAIEELETAKAHTQDEEIINKLNGYIKKLEQKK